MSRIRAKDTKAELVIRKLLWALGYRYRLHSRLPGTPDIAFTSKKVVIFVDGCFWHLCPLHFTMPKTNATFWRNKITENRARDKRTSAELRKRGFKVVRVWEHEVRESPMKSVNRIVKQLEQI